jgi:superfamily II DNA/RNA helicase
LNTVIATDVLSEGLNMQDCDTIINYDLHWNPLRLIQRFGRIDRIGSTHDKVFDLNFLPELGIEQNLGLRQRLERLQPGTFVLCQAGDFQQLFFVDPQGLIETRDASTILGRLKCTPSTPTLPLPADYNLAVMKVYEQFSQEVAYRKTSLDQGTSHSAGQRYVGQELKGFATTLDEDDPRLTDVAILPCAYNSNALTAAVQTELRHIRNHKLIGDALFARLRSVSDQHRLSHQTEQVRNDRQAVVPRIVCSEFLH